MVYILEQVIVIFETYTISIALIVFFWRLIVLFSGLDGYILSKTLLPYLSGFIFSMIFFPILFPILGLWLFEEPWTKTLVAFGIIIGLLFSPSFGNKFAQFYWARKISAVEAVATFLALIVSLLFSHTVTILVSHDQDILGFLILFFPTFYFIRKIIVPNIWKTFPSIWALETILLISSSIMTLIQPDWFVLGLEVFNDETTLENEVNKYLQNLSITIGITSLFVWHIMRIQSFKSEYLRHIASASNRQYSIIEMLINCLGSIANTIIMLTNLKRLINPRADSSDLENRLTNSITYFFDTPSSSLHHITPRSSKEEDYAAMSKADLIVDEFQKKKNEKQLVKKQREPISLEETAAGLPPLKPDVEAIAAHPATTAAPADIESDQQNILPLSADGYWQYKDNEWILTELGELASLWGAVDEKEANLPEPELNVRELEELRSDLRIKFYESLSVNELRKMADEQKMTFINSYNGKIKNISSFKKKYLLIEKIVRLNYSKFSDFEKDIIHRAYTGASACKFNDDGCDCIYRRHCFDKLLEGESRQELFDLGIYSYNPNLHMNFDYLNKINLMLKDYSNVSLKYLKPYAKKRGINISGSKSDLVSRLENNNDIFSYSKIFDGN